MHQSCGRFRIAGKSVALSHNDATVPSFVGHTQQSRGQTAGELHITVMRFALMNIKCSRKKALPNELTQKSGGNALNISAGD
jgi:hypothetical protein